MNKEIINKTPYAIIGITTGLIFRRIIDSYMLGFIYATISTVLLSIIIFALNRRNKKDSLK